MKFLVDAHLSPRIVSLLSSKGFDAIHTHSLAGGNETPDEEITRISMADTRVVISKDNDFYYSHILFGRPFKLVLLRTGNMRAKETIALFERNLDEMMRLLPSCSLIEVHPDRLYVIK